MGACILCYLTEIVALQGARMKYRSKSNYSSISHHAALKNQDLLTEIELHLNEIWIVISMQKSWENYVSIISLNGYVCIRKLGELHLNQVYM